MHAIERSARQQALDVDAILVAFRLLIAVQQTTEAHTDYNHNKDKCKKASEMTEPRWLRCTCDVIMSGLEIRVDRWPESTKNPVGPPNRVRQWSGGLPKLCQRTLHLLAFFITFAVAVTATMFFEFNISNIVIYSFFVASGNSISNISSSVYAE